MDLYPFQKEVDVILSSGRSVILQAPTGAGKTLAALYPFFRAWEKEDNFPRKCIYSVPLRTLANQFWKEYNERAKNFGFRRSLDVTIHTGDQPEDPKLEGNLIFTTIDQTLSNFLNIPYALSLRQGNLNAGAVLSSYLVFDELHLFDPDTTLPTTIHLLRLLRGIVPFMVMTATFSLDMIFALAAEIDAEPIILAGDEVAAIPSQHKCRRIHFVDSELTADWVLRNHKHRSIAICNTVSRAQNLYNELRQKAHPETHTRLLHSRFLRADRKDHEYWTQREFGKDKGLYSAESAILVATQVIEVGLDITSENLHTELAPAASVIQRVGRCARYAGEEGDVWVYRVPTDMNGNPSFSPYLGEQQAIGERTGKILTNYNGATVNFDQELAIVSEAHGPADKKIWEKLRANRFYIADRITATIEEREGSAARELIRDIDSRTVIVHPDPTYIENPWGYEGFGIFRGSLFGAFTLLEKLAQDLSIDWVFMRAHPATEEESSHERTIWQWSLIKNKDDLRGALIVAVNPRLAAYSQDAGLRLGVSNAGQWQSPLRGLKGRQRVFAPYRRETFQEHVKRMVHVYKSPFYDHITDKKRLPLQAEFAYAAHRLEEKQKWPDGTLDRVARVVIAIHDLGKLDRNWQEWAHRWQKEVSTLRGEICTCRMTFLSPTPIMMKHARKNRPSISPSSG